MTEISDRLMFNAGQFSLGLVPPLFLWARAGQNVNEVWDISAWLQETDI